jgi:predicted alpha/beta-fold hydrolase
MEKQLKIKTPDKHTIYGFLRLHDKRKSKTLVVLVHGLTGSPNEHFHYNGARFLSKHGLASFRFSLYIDAPGGRKLHECGVSTHIKDLNTVLKFFRKKFKKVFVVGHSLGGITVLSADLSLGR